MPSGVGRNDLEPRVSMRVTRPAAQQLIQVVGAGEDLREHDIVKGAVELRTLGLTAP